jgi:hypothetical protein
VSSWTVGPPLSVCIRQGREVSFHFVASDGEAWNHLEVHVRNG